MSPWIFMFPRRKWFQLNANCWLFFFGALCHITTLKSPFLLQDNYVLFWNVYRVTEDPGVGFNCEETHMKILRKHVGQMWWRSARGQFAFHFKAVGRFLTADSFWDAARKRVFFWSCVSSALTEEGECVFVWMAPPIVISAGGCNWAESVLLSDFLTVKRAKLIWVILFI